MKSWKVLFVSKKTDKTVCVYIEAETPEAAMIWVEAHVKDCLIAHGAIEVIETEGL